MSCGAEDPRGHLGEPRVALLERFEDAAAVVVGHHDRQLLRRRLGRTDQQRTSNERPSPIRATVRPPARSLRQRRADRRRHGAVDADPPVGPHRDPRPPGPASHVAHRVRRAEHSWSPERGAGDRGRHVQAGGQGMGRQLVCTASSACRLTSAQRRSHAGSGAPRVTARVPAGQRIARHVGPAGPGGQGRAPGPTGQPAAPTPAGAASGGQHDHLLRDQRQRQRRGCSGLPGTGAVGSATVSGAARLGWTPAPCPAITTVCRSEVDVSGWSKVTGGCGSTGRRRPPSAPDYSRDRGPAVPRSGMSNCTGPAFAVREPVATTRTRRVAERHWALSAAIRSVFSAEADGGTRTWNAEIAELFHRLAGAGAEQFGGAGWRSSTISGTWA